ncbi:hypothetical protein IKF23_02185 [Candidatus Saccharibacteria bacterium]|nr:hypothetical protein [Candidatus Saccharibacteria bacterium]
MRKRDAIANCYISKQKHIRLLGACSLSVLFLLSLSMMFPTLNRSNDAEATGVQSNTTLSMTTGHSSASVDLVVNSGTGTFAESDNEDQAQFTIATNNYSGYTLTITGTDDTRQLSNTVTGSDVLDSITTATSTDTFANGAAGTYNGKWGIKPSIYNSVANTDFLQAPDTNAQTLNATSHANGSNDCTNPLNTDCSTHQYSVSVGARADYTKPSGIYTNTFILLAVANPVDYKVEYVDDTDSTYHAYQPSTGYGELDGGDTATNITLSTSITPPTKSDYTLVGWCDVTTTSAGTVCPGNVYQLGDDVDYVDRTADGIANTLVLHALWGKTVDITFLGGEILTGWEDETVTLDGGSGYNLKTSGTLNLQPSTTTQTTNYTLSYDYQAAAAVSGKFVETFYDTNAPVSTVSYTADTNVHHHEYTASSSSATMSATNVYLYDDVNKKTNAPNINFTNISLSQPINKTLSSSTAFGANLPTVVKDGFTFIGWYDAPSGGNQITSFSLVPAVNTTYYGRWIKNTTGSLKINFGANVVNVKVCKVGGNCTGTDLVGTITTSGATVPNLAYNSQYYLYPTFASGYMIDHWTVNGAPTGVFKATYSNNPAYWAGTGADTVTLAAKSATDLNMQNWTCPDNDTMPIGSTTTLIDNRDGEIYAVGKLADGKCWMLDNLRLDPVSTGLASLQSNTNAPDQALTYFKNGGGSGQYPSSGVSEANWTEADATPYVNTSSKNKVPYHDDTYGVGSGKLGVYYNYCAATAGTYCYDYYAGHGSATSDICPTGWSMPSGDSDGEYQALATAYSDNADNFKTALSTPLYGYFYNGSGNYHNKYGGFWSSTFLSAFGMYTLDVNPRYIYPQVGSRRVSGVSVRCIARPQ